MARESLDDILAFLAVAKERSFTRAAARLGVSQSALSQTVRGLESRLGLRLLTRTTRSVSPTEAGERLIQTVGPHAEGIELGLLALKDLRDRPAGNIRITADENAARSVLWPALRDLLPDYPEMSVEIVIENGLTDIAADGFDAGVRLGGIVAKDMVALPIGPEMRMAAVASPSYFERRPLPKAPHDLVSHECINLRLPTHGGLYAWEFERDGRELRVRVGGQLTFNSVHMMLDAALAGMGIAFVSRDQIAEHVDAGRLIEVLAEWCPPFPGYHLYYPSRRLHSPAFIVLTEALRYRL